MGMANMMHSEATADGEGKQPALPSDETEVDIFEGHGFMFPMDEQHNVTKFF